MKKLPLLLLIVILVPPLQAEEWLSYESEHFIFYYQENHLTEAEIAAVADTEEAFFSRLTDLLAVEFSGKITYYLYGNRKDFEGVPGAYCIGTEIHFLCIFCQDFCKQGLNDAHEMTHALANQIGAQHGLLAEGLAVYVEDYVVRGSNLHGIVKILFLEGRLTSLEDLIEDFWCDILFNYDIAGSFAIFLIEGYGMEKFKALYSTPLGVDSFLDVYGKSLYALEEEWLIIVQQAEVTQEERDILRYRDNIEEGLAIYFEYGWVPLEYGTYPARAEEGICLFRKTYEEDAETAFLYLNQFNEGMVAWKQAMELFEKAIDAVDFQVKAELYGEASSLYEIAGDEDMIILSQQYAAAYTSLGNVLSHLQQGNINLANQELSESETLFEGLGRVEDFFMVEQMVRASEEENLQEFETLVFLLVVCVFIVRIFMRHTE
jgi:hypothetical protein